jgi:hypothetical protein
MEPIPEDIVERAEDFFFKLDNKQVAEKMHDYQISQRWICNYIGHVFVDIKNKDWQILILKHVLMIDYCYRSYPINLPVFGKAGYKIYMNENRRHINCPVIPDTKRVDTNAAYLLLEQMNLTKIFKSKEILYDDPNNRSHDEYAFKIWISLITILHIYQDMAKIEMEKINQ